MTVPHLRQEEEVIQDFLSTGHQLIHLVTDDNDHAMPTAFAFARCDLGAISEGLSYDCLEGFQRLVMRRSCFRS